MERALIFVEKFCGALAYMCLGMAVLGILYQTGKALNPPERIASSWMHELCFNPIPWGAVVFDKDWPKCSRN